MKLTKTRLLQLIREELEIHVASDDLQDMDAEEAYGMGYLAKSKFDASSPCEPADSAAAKKIKFKLVKEARDEFGRDVIDIDPSLSDELGRRSDEEHRGDIAAGSHGGEAKNKQIADDIAAITQLFRKMSAMEIHNTRKLLDDAYGNAYPLRD